MSLTAALSASLSGLEVNQAALALVSNNIANANNPDYSRKIAEFEQVVAGDLRSGVRISEISRAVDQFLALEVSRASGELGQFDVQISFLDRLQALFGNPSGDTTLGGRMDRVFAAFEASASLPESTTLRQEVTQALQALSAEISQLDTRTQALRFDADQQIVNEVSEINSALASIQRLNTQITRVLSGGGDATEFLDLRDARLDTITRRMDINVLTAADGSISIFAGTGVAMLDGDANILVYNPATVVTPQTLFSHIEVFARDTSGNPTGTGAFLEGDINSGRLRGLLDLRDTVFNDVSSELGELASRIADELNRAHNDNTAFPPPNTLTGSRNTGLLTTDAHNFTGLATFTVIDPNAPTAGAHGIAATVTIDFGAIGATVNDVITAVNAGLGGAGTLSLTNGVMTFTATNGANGVGIVQDATTPSSRAGRGFSHFFALNDLMTTGVSPFFDYGFTAGETQGFTGDTTFTVLDSDGRTVTTVTFDSGAAGATFGGLATSLTTALAPFATFSLNATTGRLEMTPATGFNVLARDEANADRGGTGQGLSTLLGIGRDKVQLTAANFQVNPTLVANPGLIGLGRLQGTLVNDIAITVGDNRGALALAAVANTAASFNAAGGLAAQTKTLAAYIGSLVGNSALYASSTEALARDFGALFETLENKAQSIAGVNIDEELANMIIFQNAFSASARLISTIDEMFEDLLRIGL